MSRIITALVLTALLLTGCATSRTEGASTPPAATADFAQPVTFTNCDQQVSITRAPQRIISMNDHVTEVLLKMGVGDRIIGRAGWTDVRTPLPDVAETYQRIPVISEQYPTMEKLMELQPDLVVAGMSSAFKEKDGRSRQALGERGINTFLFSEYCSTTAFGVDALKADFTDLGRALGVPKGAEKVIAEVTDPLEQLKRELAGTTPVSTFVFDSGEKSPMSIGNAGVGQLIITAAGGKSITDDTAKQYLTTTWESVAERAPEAIVVLDYGKTSAEDKIALLKGNPLMQTTPAIRNDRITVVPLNFFFESPRLSIAARDTARFLHPDRVK